MKHYLKRILSVILALALYLSCLPLTFAAGPSYTRIYGANRYETAFAAADNLKEVLGVDKFQNIVVASGKGFADALAGSYLAAKKDAPILLVNSNFIEKTAAYIKGNLISGGTVYLLGGTAAVPEQMEAALSGLTVKRLAGANRYETNLEILNEAGVGDDEILIATGKSFADSLSASAVGKPILLVGSALNAEQKALLSKTSGKFVIIGGESAVNTTVEETLKAMGTVTRLGGANRYETSVLVAKRFFQNPTTAVLAYAKNFPDGLCGGPLAYAMGAPLILTATGSEAAADAYTAENGITSGYVLGGAGLISDYSCQMIFDGKTHTHSYTSKQTDPTCTSKGYTTYTCSCGDSYKSDEKPALGHNWGNWVVTKEPTTSSEGQETRTCSTCKATETRRVDKLSADDDVITDCNELGLEHTMSAADRAKITRGDNYYKIVCICGHGCSGSDRDAALAQFNAHVAEKQYSYCGEIIRESANHYHNYPSNTIICAVCGKTVKYNKCALACYGTGHGECPYD